MIKIIVLMLSILFVGMGDSCYSQQMIVIDNQYYNQNVFVVSNIQNVQNSYVSQSYAVAYYQPIYYNMYSGGPVYYSYVQYYSPNYTVQYQPVVVQKKCCLMGPYRY